MKLPIPSEGITPRPGNRALAIIRIRTGASMGEAIGMVKDVQTLRLGTGQDIVELVIAMIEDGRLPQLLSERRQLDRRRAGIQAMGIPVTPTTCPRCRGEATDTVEPGYICLLCRGSGRVS
ncbi:hypothetical protein RIF23_12715 [Lipingzhangella sp. LS1_29]|uniref:Uncharacterized protein n=1 Tax=Lipingzhangella rawalii TaxID=2055835 RepID=A0ABU2H847_9ACTN|nr:hypothetical protein [Lipingzhangella rawalii]MDS1271157.1 hypothetical protein [Lipingzhangella rawalii]